MEAYKSRVLKRLHTALDFGGFFFDGFDFANVLLYHLEGRDTEAAITLLCLIPAMGNCRALPVRLTLKLGDNAGEALIKLGKKYLPDLMEKGSRFLDWTGGKVDDVWRWIQKKLGKAGVEGGSKILTIEEAEKYAFNAIKGPNNADAVVLGKYECGSATSYDAVAKDMNAQYFNIDNWDELSLQYSTDEIWKINQRVLDIQTSSGREIYLSHDPTKYVGGDSYYSKEIQYLINNGYRFAKEGDIWHAIR